MILAAAQPESWMAGSLMGVLGAVTVPATVVVLLVAVTAASVWAAMNFRRLAVSRQTLAAVNRSLGDQLEGFRSLAQQNGTDREELTETLRLQKKKTEVLRQRNRTLERILSVSARLNTTRNLGDLVEKITAAVEDIAGFRKAVLYLWSDRTHAFEARAFAGVSAKGKAHLAGIQVTREDFAALCSPRCRLSNCFLVRENDRVRGWQGGPDFEEQPDSPAAAREWKPEHLLIVPLTTSSGDTLGYLNLDRPADGLVPGLVELRQLEFLVYQATIAIESAAVYDNLARNNAELSMASEKLNSLADLKANFVANVSHELRTPLTSILASAELLHGKTGALPDEKLEEFLKVIHDESIKLSGTINDILSINEMENGRPELHQVETDIVSLLRHVEESWKARALERDISLKVVTSADRIVMAVDKVLIQQLLANLVGNAFKFNSDRGSVTVRLTETGTAVQLVVEDTGIGIPEDQLGRIFDRFYQVDGSATRAHSGQGLGLAICHEIVTHHDGRIWAENVKPRGARFTVVLPRRPAVLQPAGPQAAMRLTLEPGEFMQRLMHWISESLGIRVATLMVPDDEGDHLVIRAAIGLPESVVQSARVRKGTGVAGRVWTTGRTLLVGDLVRDDRFSHDVNEPRYTTPSLLCVPLQENRELVGVVSVNNRIDGRPLDDDDRILLESLAPRLTRLLIRFKQWQESSREFEAVRDTLRSVTPVGRLPRQSVPEICREICLAAARRINLPEDELGHLAFTLQFYDVGMRVVPPQLLNKPGPLDEIARRSMQRHVEAGLEILEPLRPDPKVRQLILHHHENFDGSGYPARLTGEAIPLGARLIRLTDTLAALLCRRPWRPANPLDEALQEIRAGVGSLFCPRMADVFLAEAEARWDRIVALAGSEQDSHVLSRPPLDKRGMVSLLT